jgi:LmbE family N-acetylglucosaminyl deacetylase
MADKPIRVVCFGAHPDDCDYRFGGAAILYARLGHRVTFVSMTNGDAGHHEQGGGVLARRRFGEAQAAARLAGIEYVVLDTHDGELEPTVELRKRTIQIIREREADLVLCHRPYDYHPDHRAVGIVVQDAAYTVTVPNVAPLTRHLDRSPVVGYLFDSFRVPVPYVTHIAIDTDGVFDLKTDMFACHESQVFEWLPYNGVFLDRVPESREARRGWFRERLAEHCSQIAEAAREALVRTYGEARGRAIRTAETVSISEYGRGLAERDYRTLFPFLPESCG